MRLHFTPYFNLWRYLAYAAVLTLLIERCGFLAWGLGLLFLLVFDNIRHR